MIKLRKIEPKDLPFLYQWENDASVWADGSNHNPLSQQDLRTYIESTTGDIYKDGQLRLIIEKPSAVSDQTVYLTMNGEAVWNLSDGAYTFSLPQGNTTNYGLRISARAPQITTGIDEAVVDAKGETRKVVINDKVFIIRGEKVYSVDGQLVK